MIDKGVLDKFMINCRNIVERRKCYLVTEQFYKKIEEIMVPFIMLFGKNEELKLKGIFAPMTVHDV